MHILVPPTPALTGVEYTSKSQVVMIVYNTASKESFKQTEQFLSAKWCIDSQFVMLVGFQTKKKAKKKVRRGSGKALAKKSGCGFAEAQPKHAFKHVTRTYIRAARDGKEAKDTISIGSIPFKSKLKRWCPSPRSWWQKKQVLEITPLTSQMVWT